MPQRNHQFAACLLAALALAAPGCRWNDWFRRHSNEPPPIAFSALPTRDEALAWLKTRRNTLPPDEPGARP